MRYSKVVYRDLAVVQFALALMLGWTSLASANPRSVAIVNGARDQQAGAMLSQEFRRVMVSEPTIRPLGAGELARALEDALLPSSSQEESLAVTRLHMTRARQALARLQYAKVYEELDSAEKRLLAAEPGREVFQLLADVSFLRADVYLREGRPEAAEQELRAVRRLDPAREKLDPARHRPEMVRRYDEAGVPISATATLRVTSPFDGAKVYLNGHRSGKTPALTQVPPGVHYVTGTRAGDQVMGQRVVLPSDGSLTVKLRFARVSVDDEARYSKRLLLARGPLLGALGKIRVEDTSEPESAAESSSLSIGEVVMSTASRIADLGNASAVLMIADNERGALWVALYDVRSAELSTWRRATSESARDLLMQLGLVPLPQLNPQPSPLIDRIPEQPSWWTTNRIKAGVALGVIASIVGYSLYQLRPDSESPTVTGSTCCDVSNGPGE